jgi:hypothetical protein
MKTNDKGMPVVRCLVKNQTGTQADARLVIEHVLDNSESLALDDAVDRSTLLGRLIEALGLDT